MVLNVPRAGQGGLTSRARFLTLSAMIVDPQREGDLGVTGEVPGTYVRLLYDYLGRQGLDAVSLLGRPAPQAQQLERVPVAEWRRLLQCAAEALEDPLLGLHLGQQVTPAHFGVMGYVLLACANLGAALARMEAYNRLLYDVSPLRVKIEDEAVVLEWGTERGRPGALVDETAITALVQFTRDITGRDDAASRIHFVNPPPADIRPFEDWFGCPVRFAQTTTLAAIPRARLGLPLRQPDPALLTLLEAQAERLLAELPEPDPLESQVRRMVAQLAPEGGHALDAVAHALNVSSRTLHRRLEARGLNFRSLRDDTLRRLAEDHLRDPHLQLADIALLLGYSEQSAFNRAFRRWTGTTPRAWRRHPA